MHSRERLQNQPKLLLRFHHASQRCAELMQRTKIVVFAPRIATQAVADKDEEQTCQQISQERDAVCAADEVDRGCGSELQSSVDSPSKKNEETRSPTRYCGCEDDAREEQQERDMTARV